MRPAIALTLACLLVPVLGRAAVFTVTGFDDDDDAKIDGTCASPNELCTLRAALEEAQQQPDEDVIVLPAGHFKLERSLPVVTTPIAVFGAGPSTVIDGVQAFGVFDLRAAASIQDVTVQNGRALHGGGIRFSAGTTGAKLLLRDVQIL